MSEQTGAYKRIPLGDVAANSQSSFVDGPFGSSMKSDEYVASGVRLIQLQNIGDGHWRDESKKYITPTKFQTLVKHGAVAGDIAIAKMADPVARACVVPAVEHQFIVVADCIRLTPNRSAFDTSYVARAINSPETRREAEARSLGSTRIRINLSELKKVTIPAPSLPEQTAIARILDTLDTQIEKTQALIAKLEQVKEGLLHDLLTRGVDENGELRPSAEEAPKLYKASALGLIPRAWATVEIGAIATKIQDGTHFSPILGGHDFMYVTSKNIRFGHLDLTDVDWIDQRQHVEIFKRCDVRLGDLLLTKDGANTGNAALNTCPDPISLLSSVAFIRFSPQTDDAEFFLQQILSRNTQQRILDAMSGNAITRLTLAKIRAFMVRRPPVTEQRRISAVVNAKTQVIASLSLELKQALKLKSGLMDDLLTGRVRVTPLLDLQEAASTV